MIRVLHIVTYMGRGGLETMLMNYYRNIDRTKVQFDFLVHRDFEADYDKEILEMGGKIYHMSRLVPWSKDYKNELKNFFKDHSEYKIVHVHQDCLSSVALKCAAECGIPVRIAHSHNSNQDKNLKYIFKRYYMRSIPKYATELFACGKGAGDWMYKGEEYKILNNAIDIKKYIYKKDRDTDLRQTYNIEDKVIIGHVGRFRKQKNHEFIIDIFNEVSKKIDNAILMLVGDGEEQQRIVEKVKQLNLQDKVTFMGARSDVNELMQMMNVFLFPSLYEGLPLTMVEAQAAGLPIIMSDTITDECIVTENLVSKMSLNETSEKWADKVISKINEEKQEHSSEIRKYGFDIKNEASKLEDFYIREYGDI